VLAALKGGDGPALRRASEEMKGDKDVVLAAVARYGNSLQDASDEVKGDKDVVLAALVHEGDALQHASDELTNFGIAKMTYWTL